jgi:hypothetical protein
MMRGRKTLWLDAEEIGSGAGAAVSEAELTSKTLRTNSDNTLRLNLRNACEFIILLTQQAAGCQTSQRSVTAARAKFIDVG